jgi:pimeloyl-[acyl-carrier protein] methyl ester esterase
VRLLFLHGWGFDAAIWDRVRAALAPIETVAWDRGYFGSPVRSEVDAPFIAVGHSLGSLILAADPPPGCSGLIAINGFDCFAGEGLVATRTLDRMRNRFTSAPEAVLADFRRRAGGQNHAAPIDQARLARDLDRLANDDARGKAQPRLVLHGGEDPILPPAMRDAVFPGAPRVTLAAGGHLLPLSHPEFCAGHIRAVLA